ncbi:MAG: response regulator [Myxococcaceae bacterium]
MKGVGCRALVVEDEAPSREGLAALLEDHGFEVAVAEEGAVAIAKLEAGFEPDIILTDLMMPNMSGWQLHDALKARSRWEDIPILVLCGMTEAQRGHLQIEGSFEKPIQSAPLLQRIREVCGLV